MSSRRSRSGGSAISIVLRRKSRSCRNRPASTSAWRSALVAERMRTLTRRVREEPTPLELAGLEHAQQLGLLVQRDVGDLVEEQRAAVGELEAADAIGLRVGERALHVAEQLALEHAFREAAGVHRHQRLAGARRDRVERLRDRALAGAVLAGDEHVRVRRPDARDQLQHRLHRRRLGDQVRPARALVAQQRGSRPRAAGCGAARGRARPACGRSASSALVVPGLLDEVAGAAAHRLDRDVHRAPRRHHDDRQRRVERLESAEQVEPFLAGGGVAGVVQVDERHVEVAGLDGARAPPAGEVAVSMSQPSPLSSRRSASRTSGWSSATRIRARCRMSAGGACARGDSAGISPSPSTRPAAG